MDKAAPFPALRWSCFGGVLLGLTVALARLSHAFSYGSPMSERPITLFVALLFIAGLVYGTALVFGRGSGSSYGLVGWIFIIGLAMRLCYLGSTPILEDDYYRYLWDGAVTASGYSPYQHSPESVQLFERKVPDAVVDLGIESGEVLDRVNHPALSTIYPPVAQAVFALAHTLSPWSITGLRILYLVLDCISFYLLLHLLSQCFKPFWLIVIYWWNPLLIKEAFNSVHMDLLLVPCMLLLALLVLQRRVVWAQVPLVAAIGIKVWPVLLVPLVFFPLLRKPIKLLQAGVVLLVLVVLLLIPLYPVLNSSDDSGFQEYAQRWEMNDALFMLFPWLVEQVNGVAGWDWDTRTTHRVARGICALLCGLMALVVAFRYRKKPDAFPQGALLIVATLLLLSPTQFPWYLYWLFPFLVLHPIPGLLLLTPMFALYYLRFYYTALGQVDFFHYRVVWIEHVPVYALLLIQGAKYLLFRSRNFH